jgi:transposase-like protein
MGAPASSIHPPKRRHRSKLERRRIAEESLQPGVSVATIAQTHGVRTNQVFHWRKLYREGRLGVTPTSTELLPVRIEEAERCWGSIVIESRKARIQLEGVVDPESLRIILERAIQ